MAGTSNTVPTSTEPINLVLFGRVGNGKSSLGNTIIGKTELKNGKVVIAKVFEAKSASHGVTRQCKKETTTLHDGQVVTVIDTPGIFDTQVGSADLQKEIVKCMHMTTNGIHGFLLVYSIRARFSEEEAFAIKYLKHFFGDEIVKYMIVVFTGGDDLEAEESTLQEYLANIPPPLKEVIQMCNNRVVCFDNKTTEENVRTDQVQRLMRSVKMGLALNGGKPFTNEFYEKLKREALPKPNTEENNLNMEMLYQRRIAEIDDSIIKRFKDTVKKMMEELEKDLLLFKEELKEDIQEFKEDIEKGKMFLRHNCSIQ